MTQPNEWPALLQQLETGETVTPADLLIEIRRIADALETVVGAKQGCDGENPENGQQCVLADSHVGYHVPADGRKPWLDA